jgi:hypothetical protein
MTILLRGPRLFRRIDSLNLLCARILALATHRAGVDAPTEQSRGTAQPVARHPSAG